MPQTLPPPRRKRAVQLISLGCAKNTVDSEEMLGVLAREGYRLEPLAREADVVVINTCGFIESAKQESIDTILAALDRKERGEVRRVVVAGCLAQRYGDELARELPGVDAFLGTGQMARIAEAADCAPQRSPLTLVPRAPQHQWLEPPVRALSTPPWTAYLKISEGCDHRCTFCAIPSFRGGHKSKPLDRILEEAESLAAQGARELNLIAQDSTQYGYDLYQRQMLPDLLRQLSGVTGVHWIRLFYCYPSRVNEAVIEAIATTPKVCQYIDMPLQHADDEILRAMRRPRNEGSYLRLIQRFRAASPDVALRTTFIVGFPGETEAHFENLLRFVDEAQFDRAGVFEYSREDGTPAADLPGTLPARVRHSRRDKLMRRQRQISLAVNRAWVGREIEAVIEQPAKNGQPAAGRTFRDAPDVDGQILVTGDGLRPGQFVPVRVTGARDYDLEACRRIEMRG